MISVRSVVLAFVVLAGFIGAADALTFQDLAGKWCGTTTNYEFSSNLLVVTFHDGAPTRKFEVTSYEYNGDVITMHWVGGGEKLFTEFSEFTADHRKMAQVKSKVGPRRPFHRC
jgi:hypothetical protein